MVILLPLDRVKVSKYGGGQSSRHITTYRKIKLTLPTPSVVLLHNLARGRTLQHEMFFVSHLTVCWNRRPDGTPFPFNKLLSFYGLKHGQGYYLKDLYSGVDLGHFLPTDMLPLRINPSGRLQERLSDFFCFDRHPPLQVVLSFYALGWPLP